MESNELTCRIETQHDLKYVQDALYILSGKWKIPIVASIYSGNHHYRQIAGTIPGMTFRMLSRELKVMEMNKLIERTEQEGPPIVIEYWLTDHCKSLYPLLESMINWAKQYRKAVMQLDNEATNDY